MKFIKNTWKHRCLVMMALPAVILIFMFNYMPMLGLVVAFKEYSFTGGILGSPWVGFDNFKFLFASADTTWRMLRNTVGYFLLFTTIGTICDIGLAIALNECIFKRFTKTAQTLMILPTFVSWVAVMYIVKAFLSSDMGIVNRILEIIGIETVSWYTSPGKWPFILLIVQLWKSVGYGSILYLSALAGMDQEVFEAANLDGASKWQEIRYITMPMLTSMVCIMTLMKLGGIMISNTGLFYQVTQNVGALYPTTQTIDSYVMNALTSGVTNFGMTSAVTFFQSVVGAVMVVITNFVVRKWEPDNALF